MTNIHHSQGFPLISILIVTWNRRKEIGRCIESALNQTYPNKEIVILDNCSSDETVAFVKEKYPQVVIETLKENIGCPSGRNVGVGLCKGEFVYFLDDDGWLDANALEFVWRVAEKTDTLAVVMSQIQIVKEGRCIGRKPDSVSKPTILRSFVGCCALVRRAVFVDLGGFADDFFRQGEEADYSIRALAAGYYCYVEPRSVMFHEPSPQGRCRKKFIRYTLINTSKTGLRYWPFPYSLLRIVRNLQHSLVYAVRMRYPTLPWEVAKAIGIELVKKRAMRRPVSCQVFREFMKLPDVASDSRE